MDFCLALNVIVTGIIVVFLALILLILVMTAMGAVITRLTGSKKPEKQIEKSSPAPQAAAPAPVDASVQVESGIEEEVVAVIMAAVSAMQAESGETGTFAVKSIRRSREARPAWSVAGLQQNTRPF
ncbi:MAG: OadG family protein [Oscillospiraceae bacterium]